MFTFFLILPWSCQAEQTRRHCSRNNRWRGICSTVDRPAIDHWTGRDTHISHAPLVFQVYLKNKSTTCTCMSACGISRAQGGEVGWGKRSSPTPSRWDLTTPLNLKIYSKSVPGIRRTTATFSSWRQNSWRSLVFAAFDDAVQLENWPTSVALSIHSTDSMTS